MRASLVVGVLLAFLMAGCTDGVADGAGWIPLQEHHESRRAMDLHGEGDLSSCDAGVCLDVRVQNVGTKTLHISNICVSPWVESMTRGGVAVQHREPMATCAGFGTEPFGPGAYRDLNVSWDGRLWNDEAGRLEGAPAGAYHWTLTFRAYGGSGGQDPRELDLEFPVRLEADPVAR